MPLAHDKGQRKVRRPDVYGGRIAGSGGPRLVVVLGDLVHGLVARVRRCEGVFELQGAVGRFPGLGFEDAPHDGSLLRAGRIPAVRVGRDVAHVELDLGAAAGGVLGVLTSRSHDELVAQIGRPIPPVAQDPPLGNVLEIAAPHGNDSSVRKAPQLAAICTAKEGRSRVGHIVVQRAAAPFVEGLHCTCGALGRGSVPHRGGSFRGGGRGRRVCTASVVTDAACCCATAGTILGSLG